MTDFRNNECENYEFEAKERWGNTEAYREYAQQTKHYSEQKWNALTEAMNHIMAEFASCMKQGEKADSAKVLELVNVLQNYISENYYLCTNEILAGLGQMYVLDDRFKSNIDRHADGTAAFICEAIKNYCTR